MAHEEYYTGRSEPRSRIQDDVVLCRKNVLKGFIGQPATMGTCVRCGVRNHLIPKSAHCLQCEADDVMVTKGFAIRITATSRSPNRPRCAIPGCPTLSESGHYCTFHREPNVPPPLPLDRLAELAGGRPSPSFDALRREGWQTPLLDRVPLPDEWYYPEGSWIPVRRPPLIALDACSKHESELAYLRTKLATSQGLLSTQMGQAAKFADETQRLLTENKTLSAECNTLRRKLEDAERKLGKKGKAR